MPGHASRQRHTCGAILTFLAAACVAGLAHAGPRDARGPGSRCNRSSIAAPAANVHLDSSYEAASPSRASRCVVRGTVASSPTSTIRFRVDLPDADRWNGNLLAMGGGGFDGIVPTESEAGLWFAKILGPDAARFADFVTLSSDSGHQGRGTVPYEDFSWAAANPTAVRNHAYEANHVVLGIAARLARTYYGRPAVHRYIIGGSNGGRAGLVAAQRYPADYDGVIALEPAISQEGFTANLATGILQHLYADPRNWLGPAQTALFARAELQACDALDGLRDGILGNARACGYSGSDLLCGPATPDPDACLTAGQIETVRRIFMDKRTEVTLADDWVGYAGWGRGAETADWHDYLMGSSFVARDAFDYVAADNIVKWGITNDPNASVMTHDPLKWAQAYRALSDEIDATNPDLAAFFRRGGKLLVWYGVGDSCVAMEQTARYLRNVDARLGHAAVSASLRFYIAPAMGHGMSGPGEGTAPLLGVMQEWVEHGRAPADALLLTLADREGRHGATRPLCQYPKFPRYDGTGDPNVAASFICSAD